MGTLQGTDRAPFQQATRRLSEEQKKDMTDRQKQFYQERLEAWKQFRTTPLGEACMKIAQMKVGELEELITMSEYDAWRNFQMPPEAIQQMRAEFRGQYKVWYDILHEQEVIFETLARLQVEEAAAKVNREGILRPPGAGKIVPAR